MFKKKIYIYSEKYIFLIHFVWNKLLTRRAILSEGINNKSTFEPNYKGRLKDILDHF